MKQRLVILVLICLFLLASHVQAQDADSQWYTELAKGDWSNEVMLGTTTTSYDNSHTGGNWLGYTTQADISYFFTNDFSAGFRVGAEYSSDRRTDEQMYNLGLVSKYYIPLDSNRVYPYIGGQYNYFLMETDYQHMRDYEQYGWMYGPLLGVRYYYTTGISVFAEYQMRLFSGNIGDIIDQQHVGLVGMSFQF